MKNKFMTVVIQLPEDADQRNQITENLGLDKVFHGGVVTAVSLEDEITVNELMEEQFSLKEVNSIRERAKALGQEHTEIVSSN